MCIRDSPCSPLRATNESPQIVGGKPFQSHRNIQPDGGLVVMAEQSRITLCHSQLRGCHEQHSDKVGGVRGRSKAACNTALSSSAHIWPQTTAAAVAHFFWLPVTECACVMLRHQHWYTTAATVKHSWHCWCHDYIYLNSVLKLGNSPPVTTNISFQSSWIN